MVPNCATHHTYVYRGVRNVSFSQNFAYVLNRWPLIKVWIQFLQWTDIWRKNNMNFSFQSVLMVYTLTLWCLVSNLVPSASFIVRGRQNRNEILKLFWWGGWCSVHKMVKHTLKILQHLLQDFQRAFDHFVDTRHCSRVK